MGKTCPVLCLACSPVNFHTTQHHTHPTHTRNLRKVDILLKALDRQGKHVDYYALDLSELELRRTLAAIPHDAYRHVRCFGLLGTYDDGFDWLQRPEVNSRTKIVMSLGSSIGNFSRPEAADFLHNFARALGHGDRLLIGLDACKDAAKVHRAYNDSQNLTHRFYLQGLLHANELLGSDAFDVSQWHVIGQYDEAGGRHRAFMTPDCDVHVGEATIRAGERIRLEEAYKYSAQESDKLWSDARLKLVDQWQNPSQDYGTYDVVLPDLPFPHTGICTPYKHRPALSAQPLLSLRLHRARACVRFSDFVTLLTSSNPFSAIHMLGKGSYACATDATVYAPTPVPSLAEWTELWALWDAVTRKMIPDDELLNKPIKLRNACVFYLGHIPTFLDMKIASQTDGVQTEPRTYPSIFERGIDPDVDNPEQCHAHSDIPDEWPPLSEILGFQQRVRARVTSLYESGAAAQDLKVARVLWLGYEHEAMHLETLLYMLVQSEKTLPPPNTPVPNFSVLAEQAAAAAVPNSWTTIPESTLTIGTNDPQTASGPARYFGWDVETPARQATVPSFSASARVLSNGDYAAFLEATQSPAMPAAWTSSAPVNGHGDVAGKYAAAAGGGSGPSAGFLAGRAVRTVYGPVPLALALHWPASASYDELRACAAHMGGRVPTHEEVLSIYAHAEASAAKLSSSAAGVPAVNGHLLANGVRESPPAAAGAGAGAGAPAPAPGSAFADLGGEGANVGFQHWHPAAVTQLGARLAGRGMAGGVWEWTSTPLRKFEGWEAMPLYPAYSGECLFFSVYPCGGGEFVWWPCECADKGSLRDEQRIFSMASTTSCSEAAGRLCRGSREDVPCEFFFFSFFLSLFRCRASMALGRAD